MVEANFDFSDSPVTQNQVVRPPLTEQVWNAVGSAILKVAQQLPEGMAKAADLLDGPEVAPAPRRNGKEVTDEAIAAVLGVGDQQDPAKLAALRKALSAYDAAEKAAETDEQFAKLLGYSREKGFYVSREKDGSFTVVIGTEDRGTSNYRLTVPKEGKILVESKVNGAFVPGYRQGGSLADALKTLAAGSMEKK